jgi:hypothetical protein
MEKKCLIVSRDEKKNLFCSTFSFNVKMFHNKNTKSFLRKKMEKEKKVAPVNVNESWTRGRRLKFINYKTEINN